MINAVDTDVISWRVVPKCLGLPDAAAARVGSIIGPLAYDLRSVEFLQCDWGKRVGGIAHPHVRNGLTHQISAKTGDR